MKREARKRKSYERCILVQSSLYFSFFYRLDKKRKKSLPVTTPHSLFQTLVRSLYHLVLAMFFISMMLCWFLKSKSVSQNLFSVGQLCDDRQSYAIFTPTSSVLGDITSYQCLFGSPPDYESLRLIFCYAYIPAQLRQKLAPSANRCFLKGHASAQKGFRCFDPSSRSRRPGIWPSMSTSSSTPPFFF